MALDVCNGGDSLEKCDRGKIWVKICDGEARRVDICSWVRVLEFYHSTSGVLQIIGAFEVKNNLGMF